MRKADLVSTVARKAGIPVPKARLAVEAVLACLAAPPRATPKPGARRSIKASRLPRFNPGMAARGPKFKPGKAAKGPKFRAGKALRDAIN